MRRYDVARATAAAPAPYAAGAAAPGRSAALVVIDRTSDLLTPAAGHQGFLAKAFAASARPCRAPPLLDTLAPVDVRFPPLESAAMLAMEGPAAPTTPSGHGEGRGDAEGGGDGGCNEAGKNAREDMMGSCLAQPHDTKARDWIAAASAKYAADAAVTARQGSQTHQASVWANMAAFQ